MRRLYDVLEITGIVTLILVIGLSIITVTMLLWVELGLRSCS